MTSEEFVKEKLPKARAEKHTTGRKTTYWLIRDGRNTMYIASGYSESNAWVNAKQKLIENEINRNND